MTSLYFYSAWIARGFTLELTVVSLIFCLRRSTPGYLRMFPIYAIANSLMALGELLYHGVFFYFYSGYFVFESIFFLIFFRKLLKERLSKKAMAIISIIITSITLLGIFDPHFKFPLQILFGTECVVMITLSLIYFVHILRNKKLGDFSKISSFWLVLGILFYFLIVLPTISFWTYTLVMHLTNISTIIYSANNFATCVSYVLFTIGMIRGKNSPTWAVNLVPEDSRSY